MRFNSVPQLLSISCTGDIGMQLGASTPEDSKMDRRYRLIRNEDSRR